MAAVSVEPLLPPHPTSISPTRGTLKSVLSWYFLDSLTKSYWSVELSLSLIRHLFNKISKVHSLNMIKQCLKNLASHFNFYTAKKI
ncbi:hypothetical protein BpHYR1_034609 [Brachionus plicatilis]|uniref:Uncharacterized protein n=1 Tax=Brachionus plicatilis TaxID=10195 RepID=A0A3M7T086_BRAPC|nr:hypothetical protein BpHYR1_034609 [Brachionus plicatilis]